MDIRLLPIHLFFIYIYNINLISIVNISFNIYIKSIYIVANKTREVLILIGQQHFWQLIINDLLNK